MAVQHEDVVEALSLHTPQALRGVLEAAGVSPRSATTSRELATRIADALWWHSSTPIGYVTGALTLDAVVDHVAKKARIDGALGTGDAWERTARLTVMMVGESHGPVGWSDLHESRQARWTGRKWLPPILGLSGATSLGTGWAAKRFLAIGAGPIGRLLPYIPWVGPWFLSIRKGAGVAAALGGPAGVLLSILAANQAFGTNYQKLVPLLLGVGALGPAVMVEAAEV